MEDDDSANSEQEHSYLDKEKKIVFKRKDDDKHVFHNRHKKTTTHLRKTVVVTDVSTEISQEHLNSLLTNPEPETLSSNPEPRVPKDLHDTTLELVSILKSVEVTEPPITKYPISGNSEDAFEHSSSRPAGANALFALQKSAGKTKRRRPKVRLMVENNNERDRKPDYPGRPRSYTETAFQRPELVQKFYKASFIHQMMKRAESIGVNVVPKWQQDGIELIKEAAVLFEPIQKCLRAADRIIRTSGQGSNASKAHAKLIFCFFYVGSIIQLILPEYDEAARFLDHVYVHLSKIEAISSRNIKLVRKLYKQSQELLSRLQRDMEHQIYVGILNFKLPASMEDPSEGTADGQASETDNSNIRQPGLDEQTLVISSFTKSILIECLESPELGSRGVKDMVHLQLLCFIQILLEEITRTIQLVTDDLETGSKLANSAKQLKSRVGALRKHLRFMRKDMSLRPNNCSGPLALELKKLANDISYFQATLQSVSKISEWTLIAAECMFAEARAWAPGTRMDSPYQDQWRRRRSGLGILKCFGHGRNLPNGALKTFPELFEDVEGSEIVDALQMEIPVHRARKAFLFDEYFDETSDIILFGNESMASLSSRTLSILQLRPSNVISETTDSVPTEQTTEEAPS